MAQAPIAAGQLEASVRAQDGSMEDFAAAASLVGTLAECKTNGDMLGLLLSYRKDVRERAIAEEREACAVFAEGATAYTQYQTVDHYKMAAFISAAIRERSNAALSGERSESD